MDPSFSWPTVLSTSTALVDPHSARSNDIITYNVNTVPILTQSVTPGSHAHWQASVRLTTMGGLLSVYCLGSSFRHIICMCMKIMHSGVACYKLIHTSAAVTILRNNILNTFS